MSRRLDPGTLLSIVVPVYNEEAVLHLLYERLQTVAASLPVRAEFVLVNDGSRDRSLELMAGFVSRDPRFRIVDLSRNFGHQYAVSAALSLARGDVIAIMDADLQDPPEILNGMLARWVAGIDVVYGQRRAREGESPFKLGTAKLFYRLISMVADVEIPKDTGDFRVIDRAVADVVNIMPERHRFLRGMFAWVGFRQEPFFYDRKARVAGETKYPFRRMFALSIDAILSFSIQPLRWMVLLGLSMTALAFLSGIYLLVVRFTRPGAFSPGFAGMFVAMLFMFGVNFICLGLIGEYVGRGYENSQGRPIFIVRSVIERGVSEDVERV